MHENAQGRRDDGNADKRRAPSENAGDGRENGDTGDDRARDTCHDPTNGATLAVALESVANDHDGDWLHDRSADRTHECRKQ
jgi:hypothetical protein